MFWELRMWLFILPYKHTHKHRNLQEGLNATLYYNLCSQGTKTICKMNSKIIVMEKGAVNEKKVTLTMTLMKQKTTIMVIIMMNDDDSK